MKRKDVRRGPSGNIKKCSALLFASFRWSGVFAVWPRLAQAILRLGLWPPESTEDFRYRLLHRRNIVCLAFQSERPEDFWGLKEVKVEVVGTEHSQGRSWDGERGQKVVLWKCGPEDMGMLMGAAGMFGCRQITTHLLLSFFSQLQQSCRVGLPEFPPPLEHRTLF